MPDSMYTQHLLEIAHEQPILVCRDIANQDGTVLATRGSAFDQELQAKLTRYQLPEPIDHYVRIEGQFLPATLFELLGDFIQSDPQYAQIANSVGCAEILQKCCQEACRHELLSQKVTALFFTLPEIFDQALFCAWMAVVIGYQQGEPQAELEQNFIAGLSHDLGLLDLPLDLLRKKGELSADEWSALCEHPNLSSTLLKRIPGIAVETMRAVLQHHELPDGTGYPNGKFHKQLNQLGQLITNLDTVHALYLKHFRSRGRSLNDVASILRVSQLGLKNEVLDSVCIALKLTPSTEHCDLPNELSRPLIDGISASLKIIAQFNTHNHTFTNKIGFKHRDIKMLSLMDMGRKCRIILDSCGLLNTDYLQWLESLDPNESNEYCRELEEAYLITQEILFHIGKYRKSLALYVQNTKSEFHTEAKGLQATLNSTIIAPRDEALEAYFSQALEEN